MRGLKGSFPHLKEKNVYSDDCRDWKLFLSLVPMLYTFCTNFVRMNQIVHTSFQFMKDIKIQC
jgi:hypothetical protein